MIHFALPSCLAAEPEADEIVLCAFTGCASPVNDIGEVTSSFQWLSGGGDRGSRAVFAGERGGGRNATAAKSLK